MKLLVWALAVVTILVGAAVLVLAPATVGNTETPQTELTATPTPSPSPTPYPTPVPTAKIDPGSPLTFGSDFLTDTLTRLDLMKIAELVLAGLGLMWAVVLLVSASHYFIKKKLNKT